MDRKPAHHRIIYYPAPAYYLSRGATEETFCTRVRLWRSLHILFPLCHQHRHDHRTFPGNRYTASILQLWWFFAVGIYGVTVYSSEARCAQNARVATTLKKIDN